MPSAFNASRYLQVIPLINGCQADIESILVRYENQAKKDFYIIGFQFVEG
jgi:hypothetical protein